MLQLAACAHAASTDNKAPEVEGACRFLEAIVAAAFGAPLKDIRAGTRGRQPTAFARQAAMYLAHVKLGLSLTRVGEQFGRDRTTVAHACARIEDSRDDPSCEHVLGCLETAVDLWLQGFGPGSMA